MQFDGFDWDDGNREKCQKHGVSIAEVEALFEGMVLVGPDAAHSTSEKRLRAIGRTATGRNIFVVFTWRLKDGRRFVRPVSARYMHRKEVAKHGQKIP